MWARVGQLEPMVSHFNPVLQWILTEFFFVSHLSIVLGTSIFIIFNGIAVLLFVTMYASRPVQQSVCSLKPVSPQGIDEH